MNIAAPARVRAVLTHPFVRAATLLVLVAGALTISVASRVYFDDEQWPLFVLEKLETDALAGSALLETMWLHALQIHVVTAVFSLPACLLLLSKTLQRRAPKLHRWLGRVVGVVVLFALAPTGVFMALFAKGGAPGVVGFLLTGVIVVVAMVQGIRTARRRRYVEHRRAMLHVVAQMSVAVTSRAMMLGLDAFDVDADVAYLVSLWLPVVGSALIVELLVARPTSTPVHRAWSLHAALRRRLAVARPSLAGDGT